MFTRLLPVAPPRGALALAAILCTASLCSAQFAQGGQGGGTPQPAPLPLSGRPSNAGAVIAGQTPTPGGGSGVATVTPTIQIQGAFSGSAAPTSAGAQQTPLTLADAVRRGVEYNLGVLNLGALVTQAQGQRVVARGALLPNISGDVSTVRQQMNLAAMGFRFSLPAGAFSLPSIVGPFNQVDVRARLTQALFDRVALNNYRAASETAKAAELSAQDANDAVVLAVAGAYLDVVASRARVEAVRAQLETANALLKQTQQRRDAGLVAQVDVGRSQVQALTQQQRLTTAQNDYAKKKITLARLVGLPPTDGYDVGADVPFAAAPPVPLDAAIRQALDSRADLRAAQAQVRAAERALGAAHSAHLPSATLSADFGTIGTTLPDSRATFSVAGRVHVPLWAGGREEGTTQQAEAALQQRRAELLDLGGQVEGDVRRAYLDVQAAASQIEVALRNQEVAGDTLALTRQRFEAGIADSVEVVQAQEAVAGAVLDYINSVFAHNLAKVTLARSMGVSAERLAEFLRVAP